MEQIKIFMLQKQDVNQDFNEKAIQTIKQILKDNEYSTTPVLSITVYKYNNFDFEDFVDTLESLKGLYSINSSCMMRTIKLVFTSFYYLLRFLCLNYYIEQSNGFKLLNISLRKIQRNINQYQLRPSDNKENNLKISQKIQTVKPKKEVKKLTGRFYLQTDRLNTFPLAKKIIGKQGRNMKDIIDTCKSSFNIDKIPKDFLKLRLRGKGSFHKEGSRRKECNDQLHLCVSAKDSLILKKATELIEKLLSKNKQYINTKKILHQSF